LIQLHCLFQNHPQQYSLLEDLDVWLSAVKDKNSYSFSILKGRL